MCVCVWRAGALPAAVAVLSTVSRESYSIFTARGREGEREKWRTGYEPEGLFLISDVFCGRHCRHRGHSRKEVCVCVRMRVTKSKKCGLNERHVLTSGKGTASNGSCHLAFTSLLSSSLLLFSLPPLLVCLLLAVTL